MRVEPTRIMGREGSIIGACLCFIESDIRSNPFRFAPLSETELAALEMLVEDVTVNDDYELPETVTF